MKTIYISRCVSQKRILIQLMLVPTFFVIGKKTRKIVKVADESMENRSSVENHTWHHCWDSREDN